GNGESLCHASTFASRLRMGKQLVGSSLILIIPKESVSLLSAKIGCIRQNANKFASALNLRYLCTLKIDNN
ncbi:MAG: hypothetical protein IJY59_03385, partial [Bacteroidaceae bacterium]|nr:hypothetical protein [Bacteroidaceae bacterium]